MRTETKQYSIYTFDELDEKVQEKVIEEHAQFLMEVYDPDTLTEQFAQTLAEWGFPTDKIEWSLNHSQGDGVAFYGRVDLKRYLIKSDTVKKWKKFLRNDDLYIDLVRNSFGYHYSHYNTMDVSGSISDEVTEEFIEQLEDDIVRVSKQLEAAGYAEFDHLTSRESVLESIKINEYEFTNDGRVWHG